jgi:hypothetical protein
MKKKVPSMSDVISHLRKLPTMKDHSIMVSRSNPKLAKVLGRLADVESVACYLVMIVRDKPKTKGK